jgi:hypothetical protein
MIHQEEFADLEQYGEHISEEKQVRTYSKGLRIQKPMLLNKLFLLPLPCVFTAAVTHLTMSLQLNLSLQKPRNISNVNTKYGGRRGNAMSGRGRGSIRGHGGHGCNIYLSSTSRI